MAWLDTPQANLFSEGLVEQAYAQDTGIDWDKKEEGAEHPKPDEGDGRPFSDEGW